MKFDLKEIDKRIASFMQKWGVIALRISLGIIFIWFGILKTMGMSPAEPLVKATVGWLPFFSTDGWVVVIGWWEFFIGISFLFQTSIRIAIAL
ncbi:MAG: hypothetical protein R6W68_06890, partial [Ignavibacteriaceae bacterium]